MKGLVERIGIEGTHFRQTVLGTDKVIRFTRNIKDPPRRFPGRPLRADGRKRRRSTSDEIGACGHRVLHGGETFKNSVLVTEDDEGHRGSCAAWPLLHQPANIAGIKACQAVMPNKPESRFSIRRFHQTMPKKAFLYGVPYEYYTEA